MCFHMDAISQIQAVGNSTEQTRFLDQIAKKVGEI